MRSWTGRVCLAVGGLLLAVASGCGDAPGSHSFSCHYTCPANETSGTRTYQVANSTEAETQCERDSSIACADTVCSCSASGAQ